MNPRRIAVLLLVLALAGTTVLAAQEVAEKPKKVQRPHRSGFWLEIGGGPGSARVGCAGCEEVTRNSGATNTIRLGFPLSDHVMFGIEALSFSGDGFGFANLSEKSHSGTGVTELVLLWYPGKSGFFIKGGTGIASSDFRLATEAGDSVLVRGTGVGLTTGIGYDLTLSRRFAFTTNAAIHVAAIGDITLPSGNVDDVIATIYSINIGFTLR